jgi:quercetin dioxygenase-like cupin family protein
VRTTFCPAGLPPRGVAAYIGTMVIHETQARLAPVYGEGVNRVSKQILVGPRDGFDGYLREFTLETGGHTPYHHHDWYHVVYVLEGQGSVCVSGQEHALRAGSVVHTPAGVEHGFSNRGEGRMRFLCLVPPSGDSYPEKG